MAGRSVTRRDVKFLAAGMALGKVIDWTLKSTYVLRQRCMSKSALHVGLSLSGA